MGTTIPPDGLEAIKNLVASLTAINDDLESMSCRHGQPGTLISFNRRAPACPPEAFQRAWVRVPRSRPGVVDALEMTADPRLPGREFVSRIRLPVSVRRFCDTEAVRGNGANAFYCVRRRLNGYMVISDVLPCPGMDYIAGSSGRLVTRRMLSEYMPELDADALLAAYADMFNGGARARAICYTDTRCHPPQLRRISLCLRDADTIIGIVRPDTPKLCQPEKAPAADLKTA